MKLAEYRTPAAIIFESQTKDKIKEKVLQTVIGSAYGHTNNTVSCHHVMKHDVLLEKEKKDNND